MASSVVPHFDGLRLRSSNSPLLLSDGKTQRCLIGCIRQRQVKRSEIRVIHQLLSFVLLLLLLLEKGKQHESREHAAMNLFVEEACCVKSARGLVTISFLHGLF